MTPPPPRLHVILARKAPLAVVFRRGPSKQVATFLWDRRTDTFTLGQWLKGRIYPYRSDLSADGKYMIYFAYRGPREHDEIEGWTALSRTPWLKALHFYPQSHAWRGGGLMADKRTYWLNGETQDGECRSNEVRHDPAPTVRFADYGPECTGVYFPRLLRDGWTMTHSLDGHDIVSRTIFEKRINADIQLQKTVLGGWDDYDNKEEGRSSYREEHALINTRTGQTENLSDWHWAEHDKNRVVFARQGAVWATHILKNGALGPETRLQDFSDMRFVEQEAPY